MRLRSGIAAATVLVALVAAACTGSADGLAQRTSERRPTATTATTAPTVTTAPSAPGEQPARFELTGVGDPYYPAAGNGGYDVTSYEVPAVGEHRRRRPDRRDQRSITAVATEDLDRFSLDLIGLTVDRALVDDSAATTAAAGPRDDRDPGIVRSTPATRSRSPSTTTDQPTSVVGFDDSLDQGGWVDLADYSVVVAEPVGAATWLPSNDHPSDKARLELTVTVDDPLEAVSNGTAALPNERRNARSTFVWAADEPMSTYLMTIAVGDYELVESTVDGGSGPIPGRSTPFRSAPIPCWSMRSDATTRSCPSSSSASVRMRSRPEET